MKKKFLILIIGVVLLASLGGIGTYAFFSTGVTNTGNTFTSGTMTAAVANNGPFSSGISGTWVSPANWKPGDSLTATLQFTNTGTIDAHTIYLMFGNGQHTYMGTTDVNLMEKIIVTDYHYRFNDRVSPNRAADFAEALHSGNDILTLADLYNLEPGDYAISTEDAVDGVILAAGNQKDFDLVMTLQFDPLAGDEYQGATCSFDMGARVDQNSLPVGP